MADPDALRNCEDNKWAIAILVLENTVMRDNTSTGLLEASPRSMSRILHHLSLPVSNLRRSAEMYDAALAQLGLRRVTEAAGFIGYGIETGRDRFALMEVSNVHPAEAGFHLAFAADSIADVDAFHDAACSNGARDNGAPGPRPQYGDSYYAAFVIDPDGHHLEAVNNPHSEDGLPTSGSPTSAQSDADPSC